MLCRFIVPLKSLGGTESEIFRMLILGSVSSLLLKDFATGWTVGRFLYSTSIESMKKESWVDYSSNT